MKKIFIITTGGTIASQKTGDSELLSSGSIKGEELIFMEDLALDLELKVESLFQIPSNHMTFKKLLQLKNKVNYLFEEENADGIVITHGTDTLEETAYFLDLTINNEKPIVVTGSQRSPMAKGTDAFINLRQSILTAAAEQSKNLGTVVVFNEKILAAKHVKKVHSYNVNGFNSYGYGYLGYVDDDDVYIYQKPVKKEYYPISSETTQLPRVDIVKFPTDTDGKVVDYLVSNNISAGIIIEGSGRGHIAPTAAESISKAEEKGVKVILTTDCEEGRVHPVYDFKGGVNDLVKRGVIIGKDYDSKKARIKLTVLLAAEIAEKEKIKAAFEV